jgi:hypothetical protein
MSKECGYYTRRELLVEVARYVADRIQATDEEIEWCYWVAEDWLNQEVQNVSNVRREL